MGQSIETELAALVRERAFDRVATQALDQYGAELYGFLVSLVGNEPDAAEVFASERGLLEGDPVFRVPVQRAHVALRARRGSARDLVRSRQ
jgi:hypothetical protein